jgi:hypothetical protein
MKKLYFLLLFITGAALAQIPQGFSYQAVALNSSGQPVISSPVKIRLSILENSATGTAAYVETHNPTTNNVGLFTLTIGQGTPVSGTFPGINWAQNSKFLKVEIDVNNGANYITVGSSQLLSVPYAMYAGAVAGMGAGNNSNMFTQLYMYGTFNSFNPATALLLASNENYFRGYKYLTAGTQLKFITDINSNIAYGNGGGYTLAVNGSPFTVSSNSIYIIYSYYDYDANVNYVSIQSIAPKLYPSFGNSLPMTYNAATNTLSCIVTIPSTVEPEYRNFIFLIDSNGFGDAAYGDNLADGTIEAGGQSISFPGTGTFLVTLNLNFTGDGSPYTITAQ